MSRNVRQKYPTTPVKVRKPTKRRGSDSSSSLNLSDDDEHGYSGVEDVSDSDDDEEHVFAAEEEHIINNAARKRASPPRPIEEEDDADEENEDDEVDDDAGDDSASWDGILSESDNAAAEQPIDYLFDEADEVIERHVRFAGVPDSDSESTTSETSEDHHGFFPDIFVAQNNLDPAFRREIEHDDDNSSNSGSFWDFGGSQDFLEAVSEEDEDATPTATPMPSGPPTEVSTPTPTAEVQELDGYETDGDTTEEDVPEPPARRKQMRRYPTVEVSSDSETEKPTPYRRGKPRIGRFNLDRSEKKPIAVLNPATRKMMIFTPQRLGRLDLSPESFNVDYSSLMQPDPAFSPITNPGLLMMGAMLSNTTFGDFLNTQPFGPREAFFPVSDDTIGDGSDDSEFGLAEDEGESYLKLDDFLVLNSDSEDEAENGGVEWDGEPASSPSRPRTAASGTTATSTDSTFEPLDPLLAHLTNNSNVVGAFRRNQITQQLINSDKASQDSLAFSNPYHHGTLRGIKSGSMETVTAPITPARRQKKPSGLRTIGVDLQGSPQQKRKASSNISEPLHKKQRSISDMDLLNLAGA